MSENIWDNPTNEMYETVEKICERTGVSQEECIKVLKEHYTLYLEGLHWYS